MIPEARPKVQSGLNIAAASERGEIKKEVVPPRVVDSYVYCIIFHLVSAVSDSI